MVIGRAAVFVFILKSHYKFEYPCNKIISKIKSLCRNQIKYLLFLGNQTKSQIFVQKSSHKFKFPPREPSLDLIKSKIQSSCKIKSSIRISTENEPSAKRKNSIGDQIFAQKSNLRAESKSESYSSRKESNSNVQNRENIASNIASRKKSSAQKNQIKS